MLAKCMRCKNLTCEFRDDLIVPTDGGISLIGKGRVFVCSELKSEFRGNTIQDCPSFEKKDDTAFKGFNELAKNIKPLAL